MFSLFCTHRGPALTAPLLPTHNNARLSTLSRLPFPFHCAQKELAPLNRYNILEECHHGPPPPQQQQRQQQQQQQQQQQPANGAEAAAVAAAAAATAARHECLAAAYAAAFESAPHPRTWPLGAQLPPRGAVVPNWAQLLRGLGHNPPCTDATAGDVWLNDPAVRRALHAAPVEVVGAPWTVCRCVCDGRDECCV